MDEVTSNTHSPVPFLHQDISLQFSIEPKEIKLQTGSVPIGDTLPVDFIGTYPRIADYLSEELKQRNIKMAGNSTTKPCLSIQIDPTTQPNAQGYCLEITQKGIKITAHDERGAFFGVVTLLEIIDQARTQSLPCLLLNDWPDYPVRGFLLDVSRDKVPTMDTLFRLVDRLAKYKITQFQLYFEHVFAYKDHRSIWKKASPFLPEELQQLDRYCQSKYIELVPNQNSLAHMHRWLLHKKYRKLAETPSSISREKLAKENYEHEGNPGYSLCPTDPNTLKLVDGLFHDLLPNFSSHVVNVGLDEPNDLSTGGERSSKEIKAKGISNIYFEYFQNIYNLLKKNDNERVMQFWADFILMENDLIAKLPKDVIPLLWGYEDNFPFELGKKFSDQNITWYVCPSTCSWSSIGGRLDDAIKNLSQAALKGKENGSSGYLITEWGDNGHHQPLSISHPGLYLGARFSWNVSLGQTCTIENLSPLLDKHVFHDTKNKFGQISINVGEVYKKAIKPSSKLSCCSALFRLLVFNNDLPDEEVINSLSLEGLQDAIHTLTESKEQLKEVDLLGIEEKIAREEYEWVIDILIVAAKLGILLLNNNGIKSIKNLHRDDKRNLREQLNPLLKQFESLWLLRNRKGGFKDSYRRLAHLQSLLNS